MKETTMTGNERAVVYDRVARNARTTVTWLKKSSNMLYGLDDVPVPTDYWTLLEQAIQTATDVAEQLPDDYFNDQESTDVLGLGATGTYNLSDRPEELVRDLMRALDERRSKARRTRLAAKLANTTGRTPEEAAMYAAKAAQIRGGA